MMTSHPSPEESPDAQALRGALFSDLDRLAFAIEMEAAALIESDHETDAVQHQHIRLGVRLAQRLVSGVWAEEVNPRVRHWESEYQMRLNPEAA